jgi:hypothetical protein
MMNLLIIMTALVEKWDVNRRTSYTSELVKIPDHGHEVRTIEVYILFEVRLNLF